ncbi:hypothetical protein EV360DRAFT_10105, partial [Lentinula raphanica]
PLPSPPAHVLNDPVIQDALSTQKDFLRVQTPYDVEKLSTLLYFHPNRPFVDSILEGLRSGFWPCHSGDWESGAPTFDDNYNMETPDLAVVRAYRDKEIA